MAKIRSKAMLRLARGQSPVRHSFSAVMIYLEDYYISELNFDL